MMSKTWPNIDVPLLYRLMHTSEKATIGLYVKFDHFPFYLDTKNCQYYPFGLQIKESSMKHGCGYGYGYITSMPIQQNLKNIGYGYNWDTSIENIFVYLLYYLYM